MVKFTWMAGVCAAILTGQAATAASAPVFSANIVLNGQTQHQLSYDNVSDLVGQYSNRELSQLAGYSNTSAVDATLNFRGWSGIEVHFAQNSNILEFKVPSLGLTQSFGTANQTRNDARKAFLEFLKGNSGQQLLQQLTDELVKYSPVDPIVGNPSSLAHTMLLSSAALASVPSPASAGQPLMQSDQQARMALSPRFGRYTQQNIDTEVLTLPLSYSTQLSKQNMRLVMDAPITVTKTDEALSWSGSVGVGFDVPINSHWSLMPIVRVGFAISNDLGASALVYSSGVQSSYSFYPSPSSSLSIMNMMAYYQAGSVKFGDYDSAYSVENIVFRNGVEYQQSLPLSIKGQPLIAKAQYARTDYTGDELYAKVINDVSLSLGIDNPKKQGWVDEYRVGMTYTFGDGEIEGLMFNLGYTF
jgi:hypothetical protein